MAEILKTWLNEEVGLSKVSESPNADLPLFPENQQFWRRLFQWLLAWRAALEVQLAVWFRRIFKKVSFYLIFSSFRSLQLFYFGRDAISHRLKNFEKLESTLRNLNIKFDSKMVDKIMKSERGIALRLLYQLKMCLEKVYPVTDIAVLTKTG